VRSRARSGRECPKVPSVSDNCDDDDGDGDGGVGGGGGVGDGDSGASNF